MAHLQIKNWINGVVIYEGEAENLRDLVGSAVKSGANLSRADLSRANLSGANLSGADLSGANIKQHFFFFSGVGSAKRTTQYWVEAKEITCGCFRGTPKEFITKFEETHANNPKHLAEYRAGIAFFRACLKAIPKDELAASKKEYSEMIAKSEAK
jgi:hypothetical protein